MDIIFFAILTVVLIIILKNSFGLRNDDDKKREEAINNFLRKQHNNLNSAYTHNVSDGYDENNTTDKIIDLNTFIVEKNSKTNFNDDLSDNVKKVLSSINFDKTAFLQGVESAIEMINTAFSQKDLKTLQYLLSKNIYDNFYKQIEELTKQNKVLISDLISILSSEIEDINVDKTKILINVIIKTEQINYIEDENKNVVQGNKKHIDTITEEWTFSRNIKSKENFWIVENIENLSND